MSLVRSSQSRATVPAAVAALLATAIAALCTAAPVAAAPAFALGPEGEGEQLDVPLSGFHELCPGDFDGDGDVDVAAVVTQTEAPIRVTRVAMGDGAGALGPWTNAIEANGGCAAANLDPDPATELVVGGPGTAVTVLSWNGTLFVGPFLATGLATGIADVEVGDVSGDGEADIVAAQLGDDGPAAVLVGDGSGGFSPAPGGPFGAGASTHTREIRVADMNGDGRDDVVFRVSGVPTLAVAPASPAGDGALQPRIASAQQSLVSLRVADLNDDGRQDVVTRQTTAGKTVVVAAGDGAGNVATGTTYEAPSELGALAVDDFDGDGEEDVVVGTSVPGPHPLQMFAFSGAGGSTPWLSGPTAPVTVRNESIAHAVEAMAAADLDGDAHPDAILGAKPGFVGVLLNTTPIAPVNVMPPQLDGTARVGDTLTCEPGSWTGDPSFEFAWLRGGVALAEETAGTYVVKEVDIGSQLACRVTATNTGGVVEATSPSVVAVTAPLPPQNVEPPQVLGEPRVGAGLACDPGAWTAGGDFSYAWLRDGSVISSATSAAYTALTADAGHEIACRVALVSSNGSADATSSPVVVAASPPVEHDLTVSLGGDGGGRVTGPGIDCGEGQDDCSEAYAEGSRIELTAVAASSSSFSGWGGACAGSGPCDVVLDGDRQVVAGFARHATAGEQPGGMQPDGPQPSAVPQPAAVSNAFSFGRPRVNRRTGKARLRVAVPAAGTVLLLGKAVKGRLETAGGPSVVSLAVVAADGAARQLRRRGRVRVGVEVTYIPHGGEPSTRSLRVKLVRKPRR